MQYGSASAQRAAEGISTWISPEPQAVGCNLQQQLQEALGKECNTAEPNSDSDEGKTRLSFRTAAHQCSGTATADTPSAAKLPLSAATLGLEAAEATVVEQEGKNATCVVDSLLNHFVGGHTNCGSAAMRYEGFEVSNALGGQVGHSSKVARRSRSESPLNLSFKLADHSIQHQGMHSADRREDSFHRTSSCDSGRSLEGSPQVHQPIHRLQAPSPITLSHEDASNDGSPLRLQGSAPHATHSVQGTFILRGSFDSSVSVLYSCSHRNILRKQQLLRATMRCSRFPK